MLKLFNKKQKNIEAPIFANDLVGAIGKMPVHLEFIKYRVTRAEIARLDQWYQTAFHELKRNLGDATERTFKHMPNYHFMSFATEQHEPILGTLIPGVDQSGRVYPFVMFRFIANPVAKEFQATIPVLYQHFFQAADKITTADWQGKSLAQLFQEINALNQVDTQIPRRKALEMAIDALQKVSFGQFWRLIASHYPTLSRARFLQTALTELVQIKRRLADDKAWGLSFPITKQHTQSGVIFWLQLIDVLLPDKTSLVQVFWQNQINPTLTVFFKPMPACFFSYLVDPRDKNDDVINLLDSEAEKISPGIMQLSNRLDLSLIQLLTQISHPDMIRDL